MGEPPLFASSPLDYKEVNVERPKLPYTSSITSSKKLKENRKELSEIDENLSEKRKANNTD